MAEESQERIEFKTDVKQLLDLVTHSLYSHREIFLRELISNASDAIDKARFAALTDPALLEGNADWGIKLSVDKANLTLTISDNGCGMTREELIEHIGTIARSGTKAFLEQLKKAGGKDQPELIGQFGVGFYSSFMVADLVTVRTRAHGSTGWQWVSEGQGSFELTSCEHPGRGTDVVLHLKKEAEEYLETHALRSLVQKYSDFVEHPISMEIEKKDEVLNSRQALWLRSKSEVKPEEYQEFYKHLSHDFNEPLKTIHYGAEGTLEFKVLLYIPSKAPYDLFRKESFKGLQLYIKRVFIMEECKKLLPEYLRFLHGVVDCSDLPFNVSREILQADPRLTQIQKNLTGKVLGVLKDMKEHEPENYLKFYREFGPVLKEGLHYDHGHKEQISDLMLFESTKSEAGALRTLKDYVRDMRLAQKNIYYLIAENRSKALASPHLEIFRSQDIEVLLLTDAVDEWVIPALGEYDKKPLKPVNQGALDDSDVKGDEGNLKQWNKTYGALLKSLQTPLDENIKEVRLSTRLTDSACCLTSETGGMTPQMERMFQAMGQAVPKQKKILELNPKHPLLEALQKIHAKDKESAILTDYARLLYDQAILSEGGALPDALHFTKKVSELMVKALSH